MSEEIKVIAFMLRDLGEHARSPFPELLVYEPENALPRLPMGLAREGQDLRMRALKIATKHSGIGNFSSIKPLQPKGVESPWLIARNEPLGSLRHWRHLLDGNRIHVRWAPLDGRLRLSDPSQSLLAKYESLLLD